MKKIFAVVLLVALGLGFVATQAFAKDNWYHLSAKEAQNSKLGKEKLKPEIKLYMKGQSHPKTIKTLGEYKSNKRTNGFGKSAESACERVFVSALMALQDRATKEGGNAVIDIYSVTKDKTFESAEQYSCIKGGFVTNVVLMGTVATLAK